MEKSRKEEKTMKITINCPACKLGVDVELREEPDPIFEDYFSDCYNICLNCGLNIHVAVTGRKPISEKEVVF